ncbi:MAG: type VI secretion system tube protein TssD [Myxococcota bacterium]
MAMAVHLTLSANGSAIEGDGVTRTGEEGSIECTSYNWELDRPVEKDGTPSGDHIHRPISITKYIDKTSPLLIQALLKSEECEGHFAFYRPSPSGDGEYEQYYTVNFEQARIVGVSQSAAESVGVSDPPIEIVEIAFRKVTFTFEPDGIQAADPPA